MTGVTGVPPSAVAVVGAGRMGRGIALSCAIAGVPVTLIDLKARSLDDATRVEREALGEVARDLGFLVSLGLLDEAAVPVMMSRVAIRRDDAARQALVACEVIFEGLPETVDAKRTAFEWIGDRKSTRLNSSH